MQHVPPAGQTMELTLPSWPVLWESCRAQQSLGHQCMFAVGSVEEDLQQECPWIMQSEKHWVRCHLSNSQCTLVLIWLRRCPRRRQTRASMTAYLAFSFLRAGVKPKVWCFSSKSWGLVENGKAEAARTHHNHVKSIITHIRRQCRREKDDANEFLNLVLKCEVISDVQLIFHEHTFSWVGKT